MSSKQRFISAITLAFALLTLTVFASAQEKTTSDSAAVPEKMERKGPGRFKGEGRGEPGMHGPRGPHGPGGMLRGLHKLDLTEAQKTQIHDIMESKRAGFEQTREQLRTLHEAKRGGTITTEQQTQFDNLRAQMKQNAEATHQQILGLLTTEQRTKLETMKQEMDQRRQERRERGPRPGRGEGAPPADKPTDN